jgi:hypothetical protein
MFYKKDRNFVTTLIGRKSLNETFCVNIIWKTSFGWDTNLVENYSDLAIQMNKLGIYSGMTITFYA